MFVVRDVTMEDAGRILEIYDHYVRNTAITFEYETNSANFHAHLGFAEVGRFHKCGYKFGRWYDMIWMRYGSLPEGGNAWKNSGGNVRCLFAYLLWI